MEREELAAKVKANKDAALLEELHVKTAALMELDRKVEGGLDALGVIEEPVEILTAHNKVSMQLNKMSLLLNSACDALSKRADELEVEGVDEDCPEKIMLSEYYKALVATIKTNPALSLDGQDGDWDDDEAGTMDAVKKQNSRRKWLSSALLGVGGVALLGGMSIPKANAIVASDPAMLAAFQSWVAKNTVDVKARYAQVIEQINNIQQLFGALDVINKALIGGVDALLSVTNEEHMKSIVAQTTAADQQRLQHQQYKQADVMQGSKSGSGSCINDGAAVVDRNMGDQRKLAGEVVAGGGVSGRLFDQGLTDDSMPVSADERLELIVADLKTGNVDAFNGGVILETTIPNTTEARANSEKVFNALVAEPSGTVYRGLADAARTPDGQKRIVEATTRVTRRSVAEAALARNLQSNVGEAGAYGFLSQSLNNLIRDTPPNAWDDEGNPKETQMDSRMVAHAKALLEDLERLTNGRKAMSLNESLQFQVSAYTNSSFNEFVRASGYHPTPLLREITGQNSLLLKLALEQVKASRETTTLLSLILLELQDKNQ